ncbi:alcohol dehydrogenase catalytic domain-containing protein [Modestobacter muralis]|uniref:Alcohol dehydrogenase catalytic domain-containing protein n=1 Tax=Modestobacter muralis TaxID=1608614 RepID=A0A6P0HAU7_9ACTN|nr:alcohol dehydrogenase catalytic domain-containing protein [Modestobacter muralis]NEK95261.1 alcohol dehydrogenase catalytic domain-containing protein [Modestobacter muralis]NEN52149.1 alcohol dehydrogenase catalytic domain-containing protein [Modestobacter muralis]
MKITGAVLDEAGRPAPFASSRPLTVQELDLAAPGHAELLVRIETAGICHSDLSVVDGKRPRPTPMLLGHEAAGIVEEVGPGVSALSVGDRVVMTFLPRCGHCAGCATDGRLPCEVGSAANAAGELLDGGRRLSRGGEHIAHHLGVSAFATHAVVNQASVVRVDHDVPPDVAALLGCAVLTGGGAVLNAGRPAPGETVMVVGLGGVGMAAVLVAKALGHHVVGVDALDSKLAEGLQLGADEVLTPEQVVASAVRAPVVIEAAGHPRAFETAFAATAPGGRTVTVGLPAPGARAEISPLVLTAEARTVIGSYLGSSVPARDIPVYVDLWRQGRLPIEKLVSRVVPLADVNAAMDALAQGQVIRQLLSFD